MAKENFSAYLTPKALQKDSQSSSLRISSLKVSLSALAKAPYKKDLVREIKNLASQSGLEFSKSNNATQLKFEVLEESSDRRQQDAYNLDVQEGRITIQASAYGGFFYALQSLKQLLQKKNGHCLLAKAKIKDKPAFALRGMMLDLGRYYITPKTLKKIARRMADYKLNILQLHLTEDVAWRIESKKYPQLTDAKFHWKTRLPGQHYTLEELKDLVEYCRQLNIECIPEIDMPGHSKAFTRAMGFSMQTEEGIKALQELIDEVLPIFPSKYFHIGSDETRFTMPDFMPRMLKFIKSKNKTPIVWSPGYLPKEDAILMCWDENEGGHKLRKDRPYIDTNGFYMDWMDSQSGVYQVFFQQPCEVPEGNENALGAVMPVWFDGNLSSEQRVFEQYPFYPTMITFAERVWCGKKEKDQSLMAQLPAKGSEAWQEFAEFEKRLIYQRKKYFKDEAFAYVRQSQIEWKIVGPFDHQGQNDKAFEPENKIKKSYQDQGKTLTWSQPITGGAIHIRHLYATFNMHHKRFRIKHWPTSMTDKVGTGNGTCYALTYIHSKKAQDIHLMFGLNGMWGHSGGYRAARPPEQGSWDFNGGDIWLNNKRIAPPEWPFKSLPWGGWGRGRIEYQPLTHEGYFFRPPVPIKLRKGWNKVLIRSVFGHWKGDNGQRKWFFNCIPVNWDRQGYSEVKGLKFSADKKL